MLHPYGYQLRWTVTRCAWTYAPTCRGTTSTTDNPPSHAPSGIPHSTDPRCIVRINAASARRHRWYPARSAVTSTEPTVNIPSLNPRRNGAANIGQ